MSDGTDFTLEVRPAGDPDAAREISLPQLRHELKTGTISPDDEVRSTFALDGQWRSAGDIDALATSWSPADDKLPSHLPFAIAAVVIAGAYAAILGANILSQQPSVAMWLLVPLVLIATTAGLLIQNKEPLASFWYAGSLGAMAIAVAIGLFLDAASLGVILVAGVCVSLTLSGVAAVFIDRRQADPTWRALCAFAIPIATVCGGIVRTLPTWFSDVATPDDMAGLWGFVGAAVVLPALVAFRFRGSR